MKKKLAIATCMAVLCLGGGGSAYAHYKTPVSYLSLDINPSVELGVNAFGKVIKVEGSNKDGKKILDGVKITGLNVKKAVNTLLLSAINKNYIEKDGSTVVALTSETDDKETSDEIKTEAVTGANEALKETDKVAVIEKDNVSLSLREEAKTFGITPGKLNIIKKLQKLDPAATVEKYKDESVKNIMYSIKVSRGKGNVANKAETTVDDKDKVEDTTTIPTTSTQPTTTTNTTPTTTESKTDVSNKDKVEETTKSTSTTKASNKTKSNTNNKSTTVNKVTIVNNIKTVTNNKPATSFNTTTVRNNSNNSQKSNSNNNGNSNAKANSNSK